MKKLISMMAIVAFLFSINANAGEQPKEKKKALKTEKASGETEKKSCASSEKKAGCCASKKAVEEKK